jgi:hypothetical protein
MSVEPNAQEHPGCGGVDREVYRRGAGSGSVQVDGQEMRILMRGNEQEKVLVVDRAAPGVHVQRHRPAPDIT